MEASDAPNVILDASRLKPNSTVEAEDEEEFRRVLELADQRRIAVVILGRDRRGADWKPVETYWEGPAEYDAEGNLDVPLPTQAELLAAGRRHDVRFTKGAVQARVYDEGRR